MLDDINIPVHAYVLTFYGPIVSECCGKQVCTQLDSLKSGSSKYRIQEERAGKVQCSEL